MTQTPTQDTKALSVAYVAALLGISKAHAYKQCRDGVIPSIRLGSRFIIPATPFFNWLNRSED